MQELINDVINDLIDGRISKDEAKERVARIISACERNLYPLCLIPPITFPNQPLDTDPYQIWNDSGNTFLPE